MGPVRAPLKHRVAAGHLHCREWAYAHLRAAAEQLLQGHVPGGGGQAWGGGGEQVQRRASRMALHHRADLAGAQPVQLLLQLQLRHRRPGITCAYAMAEPAGRRTLVLSA